jgi:hypothetical protein
MRPLPSLLTALVLGCGLASTALIAAEEKREGGLEELREEVQALRALIPGQAFGMTQVAYNASNLNFAVQSENWPLATFYLNETKVRLRAAMRLQPVRKISTGELELTPIATAVENTQIAALEGILASKDKAAFAKGYTDLLNACTGCHVASEKPFLQLTPSSMPAESLIKFQP